MQEENNQTPTPSKAVALLPRPHCPSEKSAPEACYDADELPDYRWCVQCDCSACGPAAATKEAAIAAIIRRHVNAGEDTEALRGELRKMESRIADYESEVRGALSKLLESATPFDAACVKLREVLTPFVPKPAAIDAARQQGGGK